MIKKTRLTEPFWSAVDAGTLLLQTCDACATRVFYPRERCPWCFGPLRWDEHNGQGVLSAVTRVFRSPAAFANWAPYYLGIVEIDGARMFSILISDGIPRIGDEVQFQPDVDSIDDIRGMPTPFVFAHRESKRPVENRLDQSEGVKK